MIKKVISLFAVCSLVSLSVGAQVTTTTTTLPKIGTVKKADQPLQNTAKEGMAKADSNIMQTMVMAGGFAALAYAFCARKDYANCHLYAAGAGLAGAVVASIMKPKSAAQQMYDTVTPGDNCVTKDCPGKEPYKPDPGSTIVNNPPPQWEQYKKDMENLKKLGVSVDNKGTVTLPDGTKKNFGDMSPSSLQAAGMSSKDIAAFDAASKNIKEKAEAAVKGADSGDAPDGFESAGGAGGKNATAPLGILPTGMPGGLGLGVNRDPAQIAGMSRNLNGEPIGVSADNMWEMMNRRYNLMEKNGSFLTPGP